MYAINFDKDIPELADIQFIHSYDNLNAKSYKILCCEKFYTLEYVGKIVVTNINNTAIVIGLIWIQIIGNTINRIDNYEIDDEQNIMILHLKEFTERYITAFGI